MDINTTIKNVCSVYGVDIPEGFDGSEPVRFVRHGADAWTVDTTVCDLPDEGWAPSEEQAREL